MIAKEAVDARKTSLDLIKDNPIHFKKELKKLKELNKNKFQKALNEFDNPSFDFFSMPREHFPKINRNMRINLKALKEAYEKQPKSYEELLMIKGVGPSTVRALALISNLIYGSKLSWKDPCKYSFAHGGKDGWPYPVNKKRYDRSIKILKEALEQAKINKKEKLRALKRLRTYI